MNLRKVFVKTYAAIFHVVEDLWWKWDFLSFSWQTVRAHEYLVALAVRVGDVDLFVLNLVRFQNLHDEILLLSDLETFKR